MDRKCRRCDAECAKEDTLCPQCQGSAPPDTPEEQQPQTGDPGQGTPQHSMNKCTQCDAECTHEEILCPKCQLPTVQDTIKDQPPLTPENMETKFAEWTEGEIPCPKRQPPAAQDTSEEQHSQTPEDAIKRKGGACDAERTKGEILCTIIPPPSAKHSDWEQQDQTSDHSMKMKCSECDAEHTEGETRCQTCPLTTVQAASVQQQTQTAEHTMNMKCRNCGGECTEGEAVCPNCELPAAQDRSGEQPPRTTEHTMKMKCRNCGGECTKGETLCLYCELPAAQDGSGDHPPQTPECTTTKCQACGNECDGEAQCLKCLQDNREEQKSEIEAQATEPQDLVPLNAEVKESEAQCPKKNLDQALVDSSWVVIEPEAHPMKKCPTCDGECRESDQRCLDCRMKDVQNMQPEEHRSSKQAHTWKRKCRDCPIEVAEGEELCSECKNLIFHDARPYPLQTDSTVQKCAECQAECEDGENLCLKCQNQAFQDASDQLPQTGDNRKSETHGLNTETYPSVPTPGSVPWTFDDTTTAPDGHGSSVQIIKDKGQVHTERPIEVSSAQGASAMDHLTKKQGLSTTENPPAIPSRSPMNSSTSDPEDTTTLEFVALLSSDFEFDESKDKIVVVAVFPHQTKEIAVMAKIRDYRKKLMLIKGKAALYTSRLSQTPLYYKYEVYNICSKVSRSEFIWKSTERNGKRKYCRILNLRSASLNPGDVWYQFDDIIYQHPVQWSAFFTNESSRKKDSKKTASTLIMDYIKNEFDDAVSKKSDLTTVSQMLMCYKECFQNNDVKDLFSDQIIHWEIDFKEEMVHEYLTNFILLVTESRRLETHADKLKILLFIVCTLADFTILPNPKTLDNIGLRAKNFGKFDGEFTGLSEQTLDKYTKALAYVCTRSSQTTTSKEWIWFVPAMYAVTHQIGRKWDPLVTSAGTPCLDFTRLRNNDSAQSRLLEMVEIHQNLIKACVPFAEKVLQMLHLKNLSRDQIMQMNLHPKLFLFNIEQRISSISSSDKIQEQDLNIALANLPVKLDAWFEKRCTGGYEASCLEAQESLDDILRCLNIALNLLMKLLRRPANISHCSVILSLKILECFSRTEELLKENQQFNSLVETAESSTFLDLTREWLDQYLPTLEKPKHFPADIDKWHEVFSTRFFTTKLTENWQKRLSCFFNGKNKQNVMQLIENCQIVLKDEKYRTTQLDALFSQLVLKKVEAITKNKSSELLEIPARMYKMKTMKTPILGKMVSLIIENTWAEELNRIGNPQSFEESVPEVLKWMLSSPLCINVIATIRSSEQQGVIQISNEAESLVSKALKLILHITQGVFSGAVPCNVLHCVLQFKATFSGMQDFIKNENQARGLKTVLATREKEIQQLQQQLEYRRKLSDLCNCIVDIIKVDLETLKHNSILNLLQERQNLDQLMPVKKFSYDGKPLAGEELLQPLVKYEMEKKLYPLRESLYFREVWKLKAKSAKGSIFQDQFIISLDDVYEHIYGPSIVDFRKTYLSLQDYSITLGCIETEFSDMLKNETWLLKEFEIMEDTQREAAKKPNYKWVEEAVFKIRSYRELSNVVKTAKIIEKLRRMLGLTGDFKILDDLTSYDKKVFKEQSLSYITKDIIEVKKHLSSLKENAVSFLKELLVCAEKEFISWIRTMIKDQTELSAFVELASISAGENAIDIDKVRFFRDAVSASTPFIFDLAPEAGFEEFLVVLNTVTHALDNDPQIPNKLKVSCENKEWLTMAHETHGSVERSSISQAVAINRKGIFFISSPPLMLKPSIDDCILLKVPEEKEEKHDLNEKKTVPHKLYSLSKLIELQNKLVLISTKAEHGQDEVNRFLETIENVEMVGKLYLKLLDAGNIIFRDWTANIYCDPNREMTVHTEFNIAGVIVQGSKPMLEELKGLCESMDHCLKEWKKHLKTQRDKYHCLNMFTARQLAYLCSRLANVLQEDKRLTDPQVLNLLSVFKHDVTEEDIRNSLKKALEAPADFPDSTEEEDEMLSLKDYLVTFPELIQGMVDSGYDESVAKAALQNVQLNPKVDEIMLMDFAYNNADNEEEIERLSQLYDENREEFLKRKMKFQSCTRTFDRSTFCSIAEDTMGMALEHLPTVSQKVKLLWEGYCNKLTGLVSDKYISLDVLGEMLKWLTEVQTTYIHRSLPPSLAAGKANLVTCKEEEMLALMLSVYTCTREAPLPTYDEVLICSPETRVEDIELIIRRSLYQDAKHTKIYCLFSAEKLSYKVAKELESLFFHWSQSGAANYRFIIFCDSKAHNSYVITAFDNYKVSFTSDDGMNLQQYLKTHLKVPEGVHCPAGVFKEDHQERVKIIFSQQAGMGKSLFVTNTATQAQVCFGAMGLTCKTIRLTESEIDRKAIIDELSKFEEKPTKETPKIFHFDVTPVVSKGMYQFLIELCILGHFQSPEGLVWKCKKSHLYLIEYLQRGTGFSSTKKHEITSDMEKGFLNLLPAVQCISPLEVLDVFKKGLPQVPEPMEYQLMDTEIFRSDSYQRSYQYLKRYKHREDLDSLHFVSSKPEGSEKECLEVLLEYCGRNNPSWTEICNFTNFLSLQLKKCENSVFCSEVCRKMLEGFKAFVIKFMIRMAMDFAMPSLQMSDESSVIKCDETDEDNILKEYQLRHKWEQQAHPYIIFHSNEMSMEFLGFHITNHFDAIDAYSNTILEKNVIGKNLYMMLERQGVPFNKKYETLSRKEQLEALGRVFGVDNLNDPDASYQLTLDNTMKMMAIHLRFQANIPVIIMGDTGCGKTRLVQFMCELQREGQDIKNMLLVRVHGGTTAKNIHQKVKEAIDLAVRNEKEHDLDTVLFFDEANTTEAVFAIKEVLCDKSVNGEPIPTTRLKIVAACNPYKRHTQEAIEQLEKAGLGYRVRSEDTIEKLGYVPLRQLVYRVHPLPPSMLPLVWDFGQLNKETQSLYITEIVKSTIKSNNLSTDYVAVFTSVIATSQQFLGEQKDECRIVSLRDIERCMKVMLWFYNLKDLLFPLIAERLAAFEASVDCDPTIRALVLAVGVCYYASLTHRQEYLKAVSACLSRLSAPAMSASRLWHEIIQCQEVFLDKLTVPEATARNDALRENIFMMVVCMDLRVPLFLVGKPGSSKSLSKTIIADAMQGKLSKTDLFKRCKQLQLVSFQCSPHSKPEGIISTFRQCAQFQKGQKLEEFASAVVLDEIGLAEDSPQMPLKTLHPLLEDGCVDDEIPEAYKKVGFIGISNWALDPAKMNRGLLVLRNAPEKDELVKTAKGICAGEKTHCTSIEHLFPEIASSYGKVLKEQTKEFYGLRDYYSVIKMILCYAKENKAVPSEENIARAIMRNFGGSNEIDPLKFFWNCFPELGRVPEDISNTLSLLHENIDRNKSGFASRYLLLLTTNHAALHIIQMKNIIEINDCDIIFGSGFPKDQEYSQVCRSVNRVKICMETGRPVILLNIHNLYESLYDALNQCFVKLGGNYYVDLGLGTHRVKCRVHNEFKLIVIEDKDIVYNQFPTPLLNRLEKHILDMRSILGWCLLKIRKDLQEWTTMFVRIEETNFTSMGSTQFTPKEQDVFIGYSEDTCATVTLQSSVKDYDSKDCLSEPERNKLLETAKSKLIECATPDSILRLKYSFVKEDADQIQEMYFVQQKHNALIDVLRSSMAETSNGVCLEVSTHARLLNKKDREEIQKSLKMEKKQMCCLFLSQFDTEQAFRRDLRKFFMASSDEKLLIVQYNFDEPESSKRLLACAKFCITDEIRKTECEGGVFVVIITKLPRILGGCSYLAFSGGEWHTIHLDELLPPCHFAANLGPISRMTISDIVMNNVPQYSTASGHLEKMTDKYLSVEEENVSLISTEFLIKQCIQKAIIQLKDKKDNSQRATHRIRILYDLLYQSRTSWVSGQFMEVLKKRIVHLLQERDGKSLAPQDWIGRRALSNEYVLEGASFRHSLWIHLEEVVANVFAQILAIIDKDNNLDHISEGEETLAARLWIEMFQDTAFLKIPYANKPSNAKILVSSTIEDPNTSAKCDFPFSWILKHNLDQIWKTVHESQGCPEEPTLECAELFQSKTPLADGCNQEMIKCYTDDFVRMSFPGQIQDVYDILSKVLLSGAEQLCESLASGDSVEMSLIWIHIQYFYLQNNYQIFLDLVGSEETFIPKLVTKYSDGTTETLVELDAANIIIEMLEPTDKMLLPFENCLAWLKRVKSVKHTLELILSDEYPMAHHRKVQQILKNLNHRWHCINIVYLLIDHLLHDETGMEESFLKLVVKQFVFLWHQLKNNTKHLDTVNTFEHVTKVLKICNNNAARVYLVKGVTKCKHCRKEITDPAELPCGHIFCSHCIEEWDTKICIDCKKAFPDDYTPTASKVTREAVENHNKFRRKCNSFFVEFVCNYCFGDKIPPSPEIIEKLINFVAGKPSSSEKKEPKKAFVYKPTSDLSPFEECMDPSPTVKSSLLKILLRCRMEDMEDHLQNYFSRMKDILKSNQSSHDDFYFMVVRCIEDFIHSSQQEDAISTAEKYLATADLSSLRAKGVTSIENLQLMARIRFAISTAAVVIGEEMQQDQKNKSSADVQIHLQESELVCSMRNFIENANTPWPQIFLIRNLSNVYKISIMKMIYQQAHWHWILPSALEPSDDSEQPFVDKFLIYGTGYQDMTINIIRTKEENEKCLEPDLKEIQEGSTEKLVCLALAAARERINEKLSDNVAFLTIVINQQEQYPALQCIAPFCEALMDKKLANGSSPLSNIEDSNLLEVVLHAGVIINASQHAVIQLLKSICFEPSKVKDMYIPTMPDDIIYEMNKWKTGPTERLWQCRCKRFWSVENCGLPMEKKLCQCGAEIGGANHTPVEGFLLVENNADKTERGYLLGNPLTRNTNESERNLSASSFYLCRVLLHASMIWGSLKDMEAIKQSMKLQVENTLEFFWGHLEKDIELLTAYIANNADDAITAIHLFLKYILENATDNCDIKDISQKEDRNKWEDCWKKLIQSFFQGFDQKLATIKKQITEHEPNTLLKIVYGQSAPFSDLPSTGLVNTPGMWRFEQRMTVQLLTRLIEQEDGKEKFVLLLELLTKHQNIRYLRHLPEILRLQQYLIHFFQNCEEHKWKGISIHQFMGSKHIPDEQRSAFQEVLEVIRRVWSYLRSNSKDPDVSVPKDIVGKEIEDNAEILELLPTNPSIGYSVAQFLITLQNRLIDTAVTITKEKQRSISAEAVKPLSVISCVVENDLIPMALSNFQYMLEEDGTETTHYNFQTLQRQAIHRFISGKSTIKVQTIPCITMNNVRTLHSTIMNVKERLQKQDPLSVSAMKRIMEDVHSVSDISNVLATLRVAAEFLAVTGGDPDRLITEYIRNELRMDNKAQHFKALPVVPQTQLKHILSLWQILSAKRSALLVEMNQNPFFLIHSCYHDDLSPEEQERLTNALSTVNIDLFIIELHEMITVSLDTYQMEWGIADTFQVYLEEKGTENAHIENLTSALDHGLTLEKVIAVWKTAVQTRKSFVTQH